MTLLSLEKVSIGYARRTIATDISLNIARGDALAILGPNGSGKTTLLRTLLGLLAPRAGAVSIDARLITNISAAEIGRTIAYVPQASAGFFHFSVLDVVQMARAPHLSWFAKPGDRDRAIALNALDQVGMLALVDRNVDELSGGERQLVMIARALASQAACLLLDEPTASLDPDTGDWIRGYLEAYRRDTGASILLASHNMAEVERLSDQVLMMRQGRIVDRGTPAELLARFGRANLEQVFLDIARAPQAEAIA
jgi:ABC-type cobalamin/Fe3+-siderophores transport system ATPase subunit